jgi:hypothetical protein
MPAVIIGPSWDNQSSAAIALSCMGIVMVSRDMEHRLGRFTLSGRTLIKIYLLAYFIDLALIVPQASGECLPLCQPPTSTLSWLTCLGPFWLGENIGMLPTESAPALCTPPPPAPPVVNGFLLPTAGAETGLDTLLCCC